MANKKIHHKRTMSRDALAINVMGYLLIGMFGLLCVIPFYLIIVASFTSEASLIRNGYPLLPTDFSIQSYLLCLKNPISILKAYGTTIGVTMAGTVLSVFIATMTGYVLSRKDFPWRNQLSFFFHSSSNHRQSMRQKLLRWFLLECRNCFLNLLVSFQSFIFCIVILHLHPCCSL